MGLWEFAKAIGHGVVKVADDVLDTAAHGAGWVAGQVFGKGAEEAIDRAADTLFFDGSKPAGVDPATIYAWFHKGPGTGSYGDAETALHSMSTNFADHQSQLTRATAMLQQGWSGPAADAAVQAAQPTVASAGVIAQWSTAKQDAYGGQIPQFNDTRNKLTPVPSTPPQANPFLLDPLTQVHIESQIVAYQSGTRTNQEAYGAYQPPTNAQAQSIPPDGTTIGPGASHTSVDPGTGGSGVPTGPGRVSVRSGSGVSAGGGSAGGGSARQVRGVPAPPGGGGGGGAPGGGQSAGDQRPVSPMPWTSPAAASGLPDSPGGGWGPAGGGPGWSGGDFGPSGSSGSGDSGWGGGAGGFGGGGGWSGGGGSGSYGGGGSSLPPGARAGAVEEPPHGSVLRPVNAPAGGSSGAGSGMGGAPLGGAGARGGEDTEHERPSWLVNDDPGFWTDGMPPSLPAGGVIGD